MTQKSVDKEKIPFNIIMICVCAQMFTNNHRLLRNSPSWPQFKIRSADQGHISLSVHYFFCLFKNRVIEINIISLVKRIFYLFIRPNTRAEAVTSVSARMTGWAIPQDNRIAHKNMEQSKQAKYCFNLPNNACMLCFNKLTLKKFSFCGSISLSKQN